MYDIRQFKPVLYVLLLLGISGFALAIESPGMWLLGVAGIGLNALLVATGRFRPLPRFVANIVTLGSVAYIARELVTSHLTPVMVVGQFLVFLQLVKLWEQRANRDYAQLLVLSLLLMVAASMNTASMWFGVLLVAYLFLSLYCCLLFHLKVETDAAKAAMPVPEEKLSPGTLRQDQRYLSRSMRRLTALVSAFAITSAVLVFLFFPRGSGAGLLGPLNQRSNSPMVGFSDQVSFQDVARITQNHDKVAFVKLWHNEELIAGTQTLMLRGLTLDTYRPPYRYGGAWEWTRTIVATRQYFPQPDQPLTLGAAADRWRQQITLWPIHTNVLFALPGLVQFTPEAPMKVHYSGIDGALETGSPLNDRIGYEAVSTNTPGPGVRWFWQGQPAAFIRERFPRIYHFARRPEVCGSNERGPLADQRGSDAAASPLDEQIAGNIESYLRANFTYTLDLTDEATLRGRDYGDELSAGPLEDFLYKWHRGHCEYFAGAMTLMCQSLGMQARMVIGFKCGPDGYNDFSKSYTVYQSDAHAWVEVLTPHGWRTFDPTSSREAVAATQGGFTSGLRHLLEYLEETYASSVIAYDAQNRDSIIASVETEMTTTANRSSQAAAQVRDFLSTSSSFWNVSTLILSGVVLFMVGIVAVALGWFLWERWRLRRRAARIGIESLPEAEQLRLARQLGFYDELLLMLGRYRITRPAHLTPLEFSHALTFLPAEAYDTVQRLTGLFYRVRYGGAELSGARQRRLHNVLDRLTQELSRGVGGGE